MDRVQRLQEMLRWQLQLRLCDITNATAFHHSLHVTEVFERSNYVDKLFVLKGLNQLSDSMWLGYLQTVAQGELSHIEDIERFVLPIFRLTENLDGNSLIGYQVRSTDHSGVSLIPRTTQRLVLQPILFHRRAKSLFL